MKTLPIIWETFVARRRLNIKEWLFANKINTYKELLSLLKERGIEPPIQADVKDYFKIKKNKKTKPKMPKSKVVIELKKESESMEEEVERLSSLIVEIPEIPKIPKSTKKRKGRPKKEYIPEDG